MSPFLNGKWELLYTTSSSILKVGEDDVYSKTSAKPSLMYIVDGIILIINIYNIINVIRAILINTSYKLRSSLELDDCQCRERINKAPSVCWSVHSR